MKIWNSSRELIEWIDHHHAPMHEDGGVDLIETLGNLQLNGTLTVGSNGTGYDVILYGGTASNSLTWDASENVLNIASTMKAADNVIELLITDNTTLSSGRGRGIHIGYTSGGTKTGTYGIRPLNIETTVSENVDSACGFNSYFAAISNKTVGNLFGGSIYLSDQGNAVSNLVGLDIGINSTNTAASRHTGMRIRNHSGTAKSAIMIEEAFTDTILRHSPSGVDLKLITLDNSSGAIFYWDDSEQLFRFNKGIYTDGNITTGGTVDGKAIADLVTGPSSSIDHAIARFNGTTGKIIQDYTSGAPTIGDGGIMTLNNQLNITANALFSDNREAKYGTSSDWQIGYQTGDTDARILIAGFSETADSGDNAGIFLLCDSNAVGVDLGLFHTFADDDEHRYWAVLDKDRDSYVMFGFAADDDAQIVLGGSASLTLPAVTFSADNTWSSAQTGVTLTSPTINGTIATTGLTLPAFTLGGNIDASGNNIIKLGAFQGQVGNNVLYMRGMKPAASAGNAIVITTRNASDVNTNRLIFTGGVATAVAAWAAVTHTGLKLSGALDANSNSIQNVYILSGRSISTKMYIRGLINAANAGNAIEFQTLSNLDANTSRLAIQGGVATAVATWNAVTHTNIHLTGAASAFGAIVLPTGAGKTVDNVITELQNLGLVTQS